MARVSSNDVVDHEETPSTSKVARLSPVPVETFDEYVVVGRLGTGGMAEVILALACGMNGFRKLVAIKRLHEHLCDDPEAVEMFMHEARLTAGLHHANVVQVHKVGVASGCPFMAMEYLDGQPLNRVLMRMRASQVASLPATVVRLLLPVLTGLHYVHEAKNYDGTPLSIVHRDISPQNIFVTFDGQVKLLDFGIAKARSAHTLTRSGLVKGKLGYIAPEQALSGHVDRRADVWSVGVTLWEGLSGVRLFKGRSGIASAQAMDEEIPFLSDVSSDVPHDLAAIVHKALRHDRNERYRSALEFANALEVWLSEQEPVAQVPLPSTLRSLFVDTIGQRELALRTCLSALDTNDMLARSAERPLTSLRDSQEGVAPRLSFVSAPAPKRRMAQRSAVACAVALAVGLGVWQADDGDTVRAAHVRAVPQPQLAVETRNPSASAQAALGATSARPTGGGVMPLTSQAIMGPPATASAAHASTANAPKTGSSTARAQAALGVESPMALAAQSAPKARRKAGHAPVVNALPAPAERAKQNKAKGSLSVQIAVPQTQGHLVLDSVPYAVVSLDGKRLGITPLEVDLPANKVTLELRNPERGIVTAYQVRVVAGETISRRVSLE